MLLLAVSLLPLPATGNPQVENVLDLSGLATFIGGITYDPTTDHLFVADLNGNQVHEVIRTDGALVQSWPMPAGGSSPVGITYHAPTDHLFYVSEIDNGLHEVTTDGAAVASYAFSAPPASVSGCTHNSQTGRLFVVDDLAGDMIESMVDGTVVTVFDLLAFGIFDADGITYNPIDDTLFVGDDTGRLLFEMNTSATVLVNLYDLGPFGLATDGVEGLALDAAGERVFIANGPDRLVYEISGLIGGGSVAVESATWGGIKASFAR
jgi:uncharacterized protein YjiK